MNDTKQKKDNSELFKWNPKSCPYFLPVTEAAAKQLLKAALRLFYSVYHPVQKHVNTVPDMI